MELFKEAVNNVWLISALISWAAAQILKVIIVLICDRQLDFRRLIGSGGMPSSHSSFVCSLAVMTGLTEGFGSPLFALCFVMAFVVMYDATGVRRSAGQQAALLNKIVKNLKNSDLKNTEKELKELLGHTPIQVIAGALLGAVIAVAVYNWWVL